MLKYFLMKRLNKTKIALVGAGTIGKMHLKAISEVKEAELIAIVDPELKLGYLALERNARALLLLISAISLVILNYLSIMIIFKAL